MTQSAMRWQKELLPVAGMDNGGAMAQLQALHQIQGMAGMQVQPRTSS